MRSTLALAGLLIVGVAVRVVAVGLDGHSGDVLVIHRWAELLADVGPLRFFEHSISIYPVLLYAYWPMGLLLDGEALDLAIKASSIPFDLAIGVLLFVVVRGMAGPGRGLAAAALYLLNPAVLIAGPMWGQVDAAGALLFLASLVALSRPHYALAAGLAVLAGLVKPQFGLALLPVVAVAVQDWRAQRRRAPVLRAILGGLGAYTAVALPLLLDPVRHVQFVLRISGDKPFASVSAPNPWALLVGYRVPDEGYAILGAALLLGGLAAALVPLRRGHDLVTLLAVGVLVVFAFYFLPTRVHERYLFPAMALMAPFAIRSLASLAAYVAIALAFAASLIGSLVISMPSSIGSLPFADLFIGPASLWVQGITLGTAASVQAWTMLRDAGRPDAGRPEPGRRPQPRQ